MLNHKNRFIDGLVEGAVEGAVEVQGLGLRAGIVSRCPPLLPTYGHIGGMPDQIARRERLNPEAV